MATHWKKLTNPNYLGAYAFDQGEEKTVTIENVTEEPVTGSDGREADCMVLHFKEPNVKPMILNRTNAKTIEKITGTPYIEEWEGQKIILLADHSKFDRSAFVEIMSLDQVDILVTDREPSPEWKRILKEKNVRLICRKE